MDLNDVKVGVIVLLQDEPYQVTWSNRMITGRGKPVMQAKLRNIISGKVLEYNFKVGEKVIGADVTRENADFLYSDDNGTYFMNQKTFETVELDMEASKEQLPYLKEGIKVIIVRFNEHPVGIELPPKVDLEVVEAPPNVTGNSGGSVTKPVTLETGLVVQTPMFIKSGEIIRVDTKNGTYVERAN